MIVRRNVHPGVEGIRSFLFLLLRTIFRRKWIQMKTNQQTCTSDRSDFQEVATI